LQTYSHIILTALLNQKLQTQPHVPVHSRAFLVGAFAPDIALGILTGQFLIKRRLAGSESVWCGEEFNSIFFSNPVWIISHNLLHAPLLLVCLMMLGYVAGSSWHKTWGWTLLWFAVGCGIHTLIDIPTHHDDGPLVLFPIDGKLRFKSPISYWDRRHGAWFIAPIEHLLDILMLVYLLGIVLGKRQQKNAQSSYKT